MSTPSRHRVWPWILAILTAVCMLPVVIVASHIGLSGEAAVLRDGLKHATGGRWNTRVQLKSGMLLFPARMVVAMCNVDEEAKWALGAVRSASVGVYELGEPSADSPGLSASLASLDASMRNKGWERLVTGAEDGTNVIVYTNSGDRGSTMRVCAGVVNGRELVVVSATIRPEALMPLFDKHLPEAARRL